MTDRKDQISELVEDARAGNRMAADQLVSLFHEDIFRMVYYRTSSRMDAEDLTQDIFVQMFKNLRSLKDAGRFRAWLFRIALNRIRDFYRKKSVMAFWGTTVEFDDTDHSDAVPHETPADKLIMEKEFLNQLNQFTDKLSKMEREVFILRFIDHLGIREIADTLKKGESTIKTHLYRALKKFRQTPGIHDLLKGT
ncbi:RNA polymerase sigma factor [Desulfococcaceae bacterium HSG8]|nr:RNA polymerase sigma factor [Desulfococcaceae bacterium HSG8]